MRKFNEKSNLAGNVIKKYRLKNNLSGEELAKQLQLKGLDVDRSYIFRIEKHKAIIKDFELIHICEVLGINYQDLRDELNKELDNSKNELNQIS